MAENNEAVLSQRLQLFGSMAQDNDTLKEIKTAPIFAEQVRQRAAAGFPGMSLSQPILLQYGLLAINASNTSDKPKADDLLYYNIAAPSSTFICGSQGSGKSHTLSCLLENCLIPAPPANELPRPLAGIVFHYDAFISDGGGSPCEAAFLSTNPNIKVRVLCAPTNLATVRTTYGRFPNITVKPMLINETDLNTKRMMDLMAAKEGELPLYLHIAQRVLRQLRLTQQAKGTDFKYSEFKQLMDLQDLTPAQKAPLAQRLETLESFMPKRQAMSAIQGKKLKLPTENGTDWTLKAGQLTIIDLSCPCITPEAACALFHIALSLFLEQDPTDVGRVVALDEAHKYMNESPEAANLTELLLTTIRLQRHLGARVIVSTQEPTVSPKLLDLCSVTIVHHFSSPDWLQVLRRHLAGVSAAARVTANTAADNTADMDEVDMLGNGIEALSIGGNDHAMSMLAQIVQLRVGEALLFSPSAVLSIDSAAKAKKLGHGVLKIRVRERVTEDGGRSIMAG